MDDDKKKEARQRLLTALPYLQAVTDKARAEEKAQGRSGVIELGILSEQGIHVRWDSDSFFYDLALVLDLPPQTQEENLESATQAFLDRLGKK